MRLQSEHGLWDTWKSNEGNTPCVTAVRLSPKQGIWFCVWYYSPPRSVEFYKQEGANRWRRWMDDTHSQLCFLSVGLRSKL